MAVNRLLKRCRDEIGEAQRKALDLMLTPVWREEFYRPLKERGFFPSPVPVKVAPVKTIIEFVVSRLKTVFPYVADKPLQLFNRRRTPIFLLCFASAIPEQRRALDIANDILSIPSDARQFPRRLKALLSRRQRRAGFVSLVES